MEGAERIRQSPDARVMTEQQMSGDWRMLGFLRQACMVLEGKAKPGVERHARFMIHDP